MQTSRIDYYYPPMTYVSASVMGVVMVLLLAFLLWFGEVTSWKIAAIPAIFASIAVYGVIKEISKILHAKEPALSLLPDGLVVRQGRGSKQIAYEHIYSVEAESIRGISRIVIRYFDHGSMAVLSINAVGLDTQSVTIVEAIAQRIPSKNNPRSGEGIVISSPAQL
jgi:hypothetical protein